jgi:NTP pyrophosphatase (non-canonical NTP hydrolase)
MKSLHAMAVEVRELNTDKGWWPNDNSFGDYVALLHSEVSEALEAFRTWRLAPTAIMGGKLEGVGCELADVLIRLVDMANAYGIDLEAEYNRKMAYNRTRAYRHGGKAL